MTMKNHYDFCRPVKMYGENTQAMGTIFTVVVPYCSTLCKAFCLNIIVIRCRLVDIWPSACILPSSLQPLESGEWVEVTVCRSGRG